MPSNHGSLNESMNRLQGQERQAQALRAKHMDLVIQIYVKMITDISSLEDMDAAADQAMLAATVIFKKFGLIKEDV